MTSSDGFLKNDDGLWVPESAKNAIKLGRSLVVERNQLTWETKPGRFMAILPQGGAWPPHVLGVGSTRGGKTSALRFFVTGLVRKAVILKLAIHLADGKYAGSFRMFTGQPGVVDVANTALAIAAMVREFREATEERYEILDNYQAEALKHGQRGPWEPLAPQYLILDEYFNWIMTLPDDEVKGAIDDLQRIGQIGGEVNMWEWIFTQRPDSSRSLDAYLPGLLKSLLMCRIGQTGVVGMHDLEARMAFDDAKAANRLEAYADRAKLKDWRGLGMIQIGPVEIPYKANWMANPLHPETSEEDAIRAWKLLPYKPPEVKEWLARVA